QAFSIRRRCASGSLAESIQLIKSRRSVDVRSLHCAFANGVALRAECRSRDTIEKQQGRRLPAASIEPALSIRRRRVSDCLAASIQLIKSLRAIGVKSLHLAFATGSAARTWRRSVGALGSASSPTSLGFIRFID